MANKHFRRKCQRVIACLVGLLSVAPVSNAQQKDAKTKAIAIPFEAARWDTTSAKAEFVVYKGAKALKFQPASGPAVLKGFSFSNGSIEFDTQPIDAERRSFGPIGIYFRRQSAKESEYLYLRTKQDDAKRDNNDIQYAPVVKGALLFNILPQFDGPAPFHNSDWNHVKLVVSGVQMRVYVNNMAEPVLEIPRLESNSAAGTLAFEGLAYFANLVIKPNTTEGLAPTEGIDPVKHDMNYVRRWEVTAPQRLAEGSLPLVADAPKNATRWKPLLAERRGLLNLSRRFGASDTTRYVWLRTTLTSTKDQVSQLQLGFCDEVYVFSNRTLIYADRNQFGAPLGKFPDGCLNIDNATISIPLKKGDNELLVGIVNNFYGWGIIARMRNLNGITVL